MHSNSSSRHRGRMVMLGKVTAPKPVNLPSQKRENHGLDPNIPLVPRHQASVWGDPNHDASEAANFGPSEPSTPASLGHSAHNRPIPASHAPAALTSAAAPLAWGGAGLPDKHQVATGPLRQGEYPALGHRGQQDHHPEVVHRHETGPVVAAPAAGISHGPAAPASAWRAIPSAGSWADEPMSAPPARAASSGGLRPPGYQRSVDAWAPPSADHWQPHTLAQKQDRWTAEAPHRIVPESGVGYSIAMQPPPPPARSVQQHLRPHSQSDPLGPPHVPLGLPQWGPLQRGQPLGSTAPLAAPVAAAASQPRPQEPQPGPAQAPDAPRPAERFSQGPERQPATFVPRILAPPPPAAHQEPRDQVTPTKILRREVSPVEASSAIPGHVAAPPPLAHSAGSAPGDRQAPAQAPHATHPPHPAPALHPPPARASTAGLAGQPPGHPAAAGSPPAPQSSDGSIDPSHQQLRFGQLSPSSMPQQAGQVFGGAPAEEAEGTSHRAIRHVLHRPPELQQQPHDPRPGVQPAPAAAAQGLEGAGLDAGAAEGLSAQQRQTAYMRQLAEKRRLQKQQEASRSAASPHELPPHSSHSLATSSGAFQDGDQGGVRAPPPHHAVYGFPNNGQPGGQGMPNVSTNRSTGSHHSHSSMPDGAVFPSAPQPIPNGHGPHQKAPGSRTVAPGQVQPPTRPHQSAGPSHPVLRPPASSSAGLQHHSTLSGPAAQQQQQWQHAQAAPEMQPQQEELGTHVNKQRQDAHMTDGRKTSFPRSGTKASQKGGNKRAQEAEEAREAARAALSDAGRPSDSMQAQPHRKGDWILDNASSEALNQHAMGTVREHSRQGPTRLQEVSLAAYSQLGAPGLGVSPVNQSEQAVQTWFTSGRGPSGRPTPGGPDQAAPALGAPPDRQVPRPQPGRAEPGRGRGRGRSQRGRGPASGPPPAAPGQEAPAPAPAPAPVPAPAPAPEPSGQVQSARRRGAQQAQAAQPEGTASQDGSAAKHVEASTAGDEPSGRRSDRRRQDRRRERRPKGLAPEAAADAAGPPDSHEPSAAQQPALGPPLPAPAADQADPAASRAAQVADQEDQDGSKHGSRAPKRAQRAESTAGPASAGRPAPPHAEQQALPEGRGEHRARRGGRERPAADRRAGPRAVNSGPPGLLPGSEDGAPAQPAAAPEDPHPGKERRRKASRLGQASQPRRKDTSTGVPPIAPGLGHAQAGMHNSATSSQVPAANERGVEPQQPQPSSDQSQAGISGAHHPAAESQGKLHRPFKDRRGSRGPRRDATASSANNSSVDQFSAPPGIMNGPRRAIRHDRHADSTTADTQAAVAAALAD